MASKLDYRGVGDARPISNPEPSKGQGGHETETPDYKGLPDARPSSDPSDCQHVNVGGGKNDTY